MVLVVVSQFIFPLSSDTAVRCGGKPVFDWNELGGSRERIRIFGYPADNILSVGYGLT
jgi:hypothetical protein